MLSFGARSFIWGSSWLRSPITLMSKKLGFLFPFSQTIREVEPMASPLSWSWVGVMRMRSAMAGLATETLSAGVFRFTRTLLLTVTWVGIPAQATPAQKKVSNVISTGMIPFIALGTLIVSPRFLDDLLFGRKLPRGLAGPLDHLHRIGGWGRGRLFCLNRFYSGRPR